MYYSSLFSGGFSSLHGNSSLGTFVVTTKALGFLWVIFGKFGHECGETSQKSPIKTNLHEQLPFVLRLEEKGLAL
jgi:hypothetical protein